MDRKPIPLGVAAIGLFLAAGAGVPLANQLAREIPEGTVVSCRVTWSHLYYANVVLDSGRTVLVTSHDVGRLEELHPGGLAPREDARTRWVHAERGLRST